MAQALTYAAPMGGGNLPGGSAVPMGSETPQHITAPFAACYPFGFGSGKGGFGRLVLSSRHRLQLASGSQNQVLASRSLLLKEM